MNKERPLTRDDIHRAMATRVKPFMAGSDVQSQPLRRAAVLCPIIERSDGLSVVLTRRSEHLRAHPGQISFPGGKIETTDRSPLEAALREVEEEIGLISKHVEIAGNLSPHPTGTGFLVVPFVGFVDSRFRAAPDPCEVAEVFEAPLDFLMDQRNHKSETVIRDGITRTFYVINYGRHRIWGATAGMLHTLSRKVAAINPTGKAG